MRSRARSLCVSLCVSTCVIAAVGVACVVVAARAVAGTRPSVTTLSRHRGPYWGATRVVVRGANFDDVSKVLFGNTAGYALQVLSPTKLTVLDPEHNYGTVHVRVVTSTGTSAMSAADRFTFTRPTMTSPIMGGLSARQERLISARVRAAHHGVRVARGAHHWTAAMGVTAMRRARSWLGVPYSWAGGDGRGPTHGVCAHNGGDLDCHVIGFDCSGLSLYSWAPYEQLIHYAATQHHQAGAFHPGIGQLMPGDLVFFSGYIPNGIGHVAVYAGHGMVIQAAQSGTQVMRSRLVDVIAESGRYRGATRPMSTGRQGHGPGILSLSKRVPVRGGYVKITGRRLGSTTMVSIGRTRLYSFAKRTARRLVVKVPAHQAGPISISVSNAWGTVHRRISYIPAPHVSSLSPSSGPTAGGTTVTVTGNYLANVRHVRFGGKSVGFRAIANNQLRFTTPAHAPGSVQVVVWSRFGVSEPEPFTFTVASSARGASASQSTVPRRTRQSRTGQASVHNAPPRGVPTSTAGSRFFENRVGEYWYLVGRLLVERSHVQGCLDGNAARLTRCLERSLR